VAHLTMDYLPLPADLVNRVPANPTPDSLRALMEHDGLFANDHARRASAYRWIYDNKDAKEQDSIERAEKSIATATRAAIAAERSAYGTKWAGIAAAFAAASAVVTALFQAFHKP